MKVLRSVLVAFSFGFMMSCAGPVESALDAYEDVVVKIEAAKSVDDLKSLVDVEDKAKAAYMEALAQAEKDGMKEEEIAKHKERYDKLRDRVRAIEHKIK